MAYYLQFALVLTLFSVGSFSRKCKGTGKNLLYLKGDFLLDGDCEDYPSQEISNMVRRMSRREGRTAKSLFSSQEESQRSSTVDPAQTRAALLWAHEQSKHGLVKPGESLHGRFKRESNNSQCVVAGPRPGCASPPTTPRRPCTVSASPADSPSPSCRSSPTSSSRSSTRHAILPSATFFTGSVSRPTCRIYF